MVQDPALLELFAAEAVERSAELVAAAEHLPEFDARTARRAARHAHTLKGNFGVLGSEKLASAAAAVEHVWNGMLENRIVPSHAWSNRLAELSARLGDARDDNDERVAAACRAVCEALGRTCRFPVVASDDRHDTFYGLATDRPDLDGLVERTRGLLLGDALRVDAGGLYELINRAVEVRLDTEALVDALRATVGDGEWLQAAEALVSGVTTLQHEAASLASGPLTEVTRTLGQLVRYMAGRTGKSVRLAVEGDDIHVDRQVLDVLREPLRHLVVNAVDHGVEPMDERTVLGKDPTAEVRISFEVDGTTLRAVVADDGRGVDWDLVAETVGAVRDDAGAVGPSREELEQILLAGGISTGGSGDGFSGDGRGLALVSRLVGRANGGLRIASTPGSGTRVEVSLPSSLTLQDILIVSAAGMRWGIPRAVVVDSGRFRAADVRTVGWEVQYEHGGRAIPFVSFCDLLGRGADEATGEVVVVATRFGLLALGVPEVLSNRLVVMKRLGGALAGNDLLAGAALLGGGDLVVVIEPGVLGSSATVRHERIPVIVVDDSRAVRQLVAASLVSEGFEVLAVPDRAGLLAAVAERRPAVVVLDYHLADDDGVRVAAALLERHPDLPVVLLSGVADPEQRQAALQAGVRAVFEKSAITDGSFAAVLRAVIEGADVTEVAV